MLDILVASFVTYGLVMGVQTQNLHLSTRIINTYMSQQSCERDRNSIIQLYNERMMNIRDIDFKNFYNKKVYIVCHRIDEVNFPRVKKEDLRYFENEFLGLLFHEYNRCKVYNRC